MIINPNRIVEIGAVKLCEYSRIQQSGIDLTIKSMKRIKEVTGTWAIHDEEVSLPDTLLPGIYDVEFNEYVSIPANMIAFIIIRSTYNRIGCFLTTGVYDNSFKNFAGGILHVSFYTQFNQNDRIAQIVFHQTEHEAVYSGQYQDTSIK